ncbi:MAG: NAD(P)-dependent oxidoreductase [Elusimicrobiales bacterium]|nr:NAD(P)-dependent oxidoreductase [Elusimicrobiales bacterium]
MSKIFLTGASGNLGRPVLAELLSRGHEVIALANKDKDLKGCGVIQARISEVSKYAGVLAGCDGVIHLASTMSADRNPAISEDITGTGHMLDNWRKGNFIYASTQTVYGIPRGPLTEDHPISPMCWYDIAKACCEDQLTIEPPRPGRGVGIALRLPPFFGPGAGGRGVQFLENIYAHCVKGHVFAFESERALETAGTSFVGPADLARAVSDSLELKTGGTYNLSCGFCTWRDLIGELGRRGGFVPRFSLLTGLPAGCHYVRMPQSVSFVDASRFSELAGFSARQGLGELLDAFILARA